MDIGKTDKQARKLLCNSLIFTRISFFKKTIMGLLI